MVQQAIKGAMEQDGIALVLQLAIKIMTEYVRVILTYIFSRAFILVNYKQVSGLKVMHFYKISWTGKGGAPS